jgi:hypothetical protein
LRASGPAGINLPLQWTPGAEPTEVLRAVVEQSSFALVDTSVVLSYLASPPGDRISPLATIVFDDYVFRGRLRCAISAITAYECLVRPIEKADASAYDAVIQFLAAREIELLPVEEGTVLGAAALRSQFEKRAPDMLILGGAAAAGVDLVFGNDEQWRGAAESFSRWVYLEDLV